MRYYHRFNYASNGSSVSMFRPNNCGREPHMSFNLEMAGGKPPGEVHTAKKLLLTASLHSR
jgi:hypothetical protein